MSQSIWPMLNTHSLWGASQDINKPVIFNTKVSLLTMFLKLKDTAKSSSNGFTQIAKFDIWSPSEEMFNKGVKGRENVPTCDTEGALSIALPRDFQSHFHL